MQIVAIACLLVTLNAAVYEANNSDDVEFFIDHNPEENIALLFYSNENEKSLETISNMNDVLSVFKNVGEDGRSHEEWVSKLNDKVHLMRINSSNSNNKKAVDSYKVGRTPFVVLLDKSKTVLEEIVDIETFSHIKEKLQERIARQNSKIKNENTSQNNQSNNSNSQQSSPTPEQIQKAIDASNKAKEAAEEAKRMADQASKDLEDTRRSFDNQMKIDKAKREAEEAKKIAEKAQKDLDAAKKKIADHLANDAKKQNIKNLKKPIFPSEPKPAKASPSR